MYQAVFFDLDGTLLPIDTDAFMHDYFGLLARFFASVGCDPKKGLAGIKAGTDAMFAYDGGASSNSDRFWSVFGPFMAQQGEERDWQSLLDKFYATVFPTLQEGIQPNPLAAEVVACLHAKGYRLVLATNPLFPIEATEQRLGWTGVDTQAFERITAYHNSCYAKPSVAYYQENLELLGLSADKVLMVGNDLSDDGAAHACGCDLYVVTDHLIERPDAAVSLAETPHGTMADLLSYVQALPSLVAQPED